MRLLRQSTAGQQVPLGYFLDSVDGNTEETALTIANTDIKIWKTGATALVNKNSGGATHMNNGIYYAVLDATDTDTLGPMDIFCHVAGALVVKVECLVVTPAAYTVLTAVTGDAFARLGAPVGASISADIAAVPGLTWDEPLTGAAHNLPTSAGRRLRQQADLLIVAEGTAQAGTLESITLDAGTTFDSGALRINYIRITSGTGAGQTRIMSNWDNTTKVARVNRPFAVAPDNTSNYIIQSNANIEVLDIGAVQGATATTLTLNGGAPTDNDSLIGATVAILNGPGRDQRRVITDYDAVSKVITVGEAWTTTPTASIQDYVIFPYGRAALADVVGAGGAALRNALGLASANMDTQLSTINVMTVAVKAKTDSLTYSVAGQADVNVKSINGITITGNGQPGTEFGV